jgi:hypothetical protein
MTARYGSSPLHLLLHVALFAAFAWVALQVADAREAQNIALWFIAAIVLHDLALLPFYSAIDRLGRRGLRGGAAAVVNHVRVPAALSALLLLLFFPAILGRNEGSFARVAGVEPSGYLERWLLVTAALFAASALLYVVRSRRDAADHRAS